MRSCKAGRKIVSKAFTLVELLIAMLIASIAFTFIYYMFAVNHQLFFAQEDISTMQSSLRFAADRLKEDLARAGYMAVEDSASDVPSKLCVGPVGATLTGFAFTNDDQANNYVFKNSGTAPHPPGNKENRVYPDSILLTGNYTNAEVYYGDILGTERFRMDLAAPNYPTVAEWSRLFGNLPQFLRLTGSSGKGQIVRVTAANRTTGELTLANASGGTPAVIQNVNCGTSVRARINVINRIRYRICRDAACSASGSGSTTVLVRQTLKADGNAVTPNLVIAKNVVDLQFWFSYDNTPDNFLIQPDLRFYDPNGTGMTKAWLEHDTFPPPAPAPILHTTSWSIRKSRSVFFRVSIRAEKEDPKLLHVPRGGSGDPRAAPLRTFGADLNTPGSARVRSILGHGQLRNFGLKEK